MLFFTNTVIAEGREGIGVDRGIEMLLDAGFPALDFSFHNDRSFALASDYKETAARLKSLVISRGAVFNQAHAPFGGYMEYVEKMLPDIFHAHS